MKIVTLAFLLCAACAPAIGPQSMPTVPGRSQATAAEQANTAVALGYIDMVWNQHKPVEGFARYVDPLAVHYPGKPGDNNPQGLANFLKNFPDFRYDVKHVYADGDYVITHSLLTGTPGIGTAIASPQPGATPQPKVGDEVVDIYRIRNGKIVEHWDVVEPIGGSYDGLFNR